MELGVVDLPRVLTTSQRSSALLGPFIMAFSKSRRLIRSSHWPPLPKTTSVHLSPKGSENVWAKHIFNTFLTHFLSKSTFESVN